MTTNQQPSDAELKLKVLAQLTSESGVKVTELAVQVQDGAVTLNGFVTSYDKKWDAVRALKRVVGVKTITDDITVKSGSQRRLDGAIAIAAANQLQSSTTIPKGTVQVAVREGCVALRGEVDDWFQKYAAETAVRLVAGVTAVANLITTKPKAASMDVRGHPQPPGA